MRKDIMRLLPAKNRRSRPEFVEGSKLSTSLKAFTLIELLVVATIIVLLASVVVVNLEKARIKSRDVQRKADLSKIAAAVETYKAEVKVYPDKGTNFVEITSSVISTAYLPVIPIDPTNSGDFKYKYKGDVNQFKIKVKSETITGSTDAQLKAGDFYNPFDVTYFQVSSSYTVLTTW